MIIGIGTDLCDIRRIEKTLARFSERFAERIFTRKEREKAARRAHPAYTYAQAYAAKEAMAKALGTGFRQGVFWRDIALENLESGQPTLSLHNGARARLEALLPPGMEARIDVSLSDEYPLAHAMVIVSAVPGVSSRD